MFIIPTTLLLQDEFLSEFKSTATLTQLRKGCDGEPGTVGVFDDCGVCQGDNSTCTDCDGVVNGDAVLGTCYFVFKPIECHNTVGYSASFIEIF